VVDEQGKLVGVIEGKDLRQFIREEGFVDHLIIAEELAKNAPTLTPKEDLFSAIHKMVASQLDELIVVDENDPQRIVGSLSRSNLVAAYDKRILATGV
jgi:CIC family chloride channel protein